MSDLSNLICLQATAYIIEEIGYFLLKTYEWFSQSVGKWWNSLQENIRNAESG